MLLAPEEALAMDVHGRTDSAVLAPLYVDDAGELHAVFTRRRHDLKRHPGEISFPGGRQDDDESDLRLTALREAEEEIGLPMDAVQLVGALQPTPTIATNYAVYPFVGLIEPGMTWTLSPREVEILDNIAKGMTNKQVAYALTISEQTVKNHMSSILRKLSVNDRTQAVVYAMKQGWIRIPED